MWVRSLDHVAKTAKVFFIDWGNTDKVDVDSLHSLPEDFWQLPPFATPFCIHGASSINILSHLPVCVCMPETIM